MSMLTMLIVLETFPRVICKKSNKLKGTVFAICSFFAQLECCFGCVSTSVLLQQTATVDKQQLVINER